MNEQHESDCSCRRCRHAEQEKDEDPFLVTWAGDDDAENPLNWPRSRKWLATWIISCFTFISPLASTMVAPALDDIADAFDIESAFVQNFIMSVFLLGYAAGPFVIGPMSEVYGRVRVMQISNAWFLLFNLLCGFAKTKDEMIAFRLLSGTGGSAPQAIGQGILADIWTKEERGMGSAIYGLMTWLGPAIGPIAGAFCTYYTTWRWVFWSTTIFGVVIQVLAILFLEETYAPCLLRLKAERIRKESGQASFHTEHEILKPTAMIRKALVRPFAMMFTQPAIISISLYRAFFYGVMYLVIATLPRVWQDTYHMPVQTASLNYLSLGLGFLLGLFLSGPLQDRLYASLKSFYNSPGKPEFRIPPMFLGGILSPAGLLIYGWAAAHRVFWVVPNVGCAVFGAGLIVVFQCAQNYLIDAYTKHAASAASAAAFFRTMAGFGFPLFAPYMLTTLGVGWMNTVLAAMSFLMGIFATFALWRYGERLRMKIYPDSS